MPSLCPACQPLEHTSMSLLAWQHSQLGVFVSLVAQQQPCRTCLSDLSNPWFIHPSHCQGLLHNKNAASAVRRQSELSRCGDASLQQPCGSFSVQGLARVACLHCGTALSNTRLEYLGFSEPHLAIPLCMASKDADAATLWFQIFVNLLHVEDHNLSTEHHPILCLCLQGQAKARAKRSPCSNERIIMIESRSNNLFAGIRGKALYMDCPAAKSMGSGCF